MTFPTNLPPSLRILDLPRSIDTSEDVVTELIAVLDPCSLTTRTLPLPSASPSPPTPSHSPLPLPHHPHPPTPLCLSQHLRPNGAIPSHSNNLASHSDGSLTNFVQSIVVLLSTPNQMITTATMEILEALINLCSAKIRLAFFKADLITQLINSLNPQSLSLSDCEDIHINLMKIINCCIWLPTPYGLRTLEIEDGNEQQDVHEIVLTQVLMPSEKNICHLCVNRSSIINGKQSRFFLILLARLLKISPYYRPTLEFVLHMPVFLTIPSCLAFFENDYSIYWFLSYMVDAQREWNDTRGEVQQMWKTVDRMLRTEGIEDVIEEKLPNDQNGDFGQWIVDNSIIWNNLLGMNGPWRG
ncbi:hypothetical protein BLNAU_4834 [Blattamonas nauphoetae]|uniref:Uncharacterized protein n=1 Tax=Blattamonas nauphoetae TaxID=2049346 RepID=A0ABQ9Y925_9EUKA|nr:hypothetical protein BLNAU_4834 [Blattamonas nauphoetae]